MARRLAKGPWHTAPLVVYKMFLVLLEVLVAVFPVSMALYVFTDRLLSAYSLSPKVLLMFGFSTTVLYLVPKTHADFFCLETLSQ